MSGRDPIHKGENYGELVKMWRQDPVLASKDILGVDLDKHQRIIMRRRWKHNTHIDVLSRGTGKCISPDSMVLTDRGMLSLGELQPCDLLPGQDAVLDLGVYGPSGATKAVAWYNDGVQDGIRVTCEVVPDTCGTKSHKVVVQRGCSRLPVRLDELQVGDHLVVPRGQKVFGDESVVDYQSMFGGDLEEIPHCVRRGTQRVWQRFLRGLLDRLGDIDDQGVISYRSPSRRLIDQIQMALLNFGIISRRHSESSGWRLEIERCDAGKFVDEIGLERRHKHILSESLYFAIYCHMDDSGSTESYLAPIASLTPWTGQAVDLVVPEGHLFLANGIYQHNTFLSAVDSCLRAVLKPGNSVGIIGPSFRQCLFLNQGTLPIFTSRGMFRDPSSFMRDINVGDEVQAFLNHQKISKKWVNPVKAGYTLELHNGTRFGGLKKHVSLVMTPDLDFEWKTLEEIEVGDVVAIRCGGSLFGSTIAELPPYFGTYPVKLDGHLAWWLGVIMGSGSTLGHDEIRVRLDNQDAVNRFHRVSDALFEQKAVEITSRDVGRILSLRNINIRRWLDRCGIRCGSEDRVTPECLLAAPKWLVVEYLRGLFDAAHAFTYADVGSPESGRYSFGVLVSSESLARETQAMLQNLGIECDLKLKDRSYDPAAGKASFYTVWCLLVDKVRDVNRFCKTIGHTHIERLDEILPQTSGFMRKHHLGRTIPGAGDLMIRMAKRVVPVMTGQRPALGILKNFIQKDDPHRDASFEQMYLACKETLRYFPDDAEAARIAELIKGEWSFTRVMSKTTTDGKSFDISVDNEHCYVAGGVVHHNSKFAWKEVEKLWQMSPILQDLTTDHPKTTPEKCYLKFKPTPGSHSAIIEALPLGTDGAKIRGARYFDVFAEEAAQIEDDILNIVVRGFMATNADPMKQVQMMAELRKQVEAGEMSEEEMFRSTKGNRYVMSTTSYYQYNHIWKRVNTIIDSIEKEQRSLQRAGKSTKHITMSGAPHNDGQLPARVISNGVTGICAFNCFDPSEGFLNMQSIMTAREEMSDYQWRMEYACFSAGAPIVTMRGHVPIEAIREGDMVLTHRGRFCPVTSTMKRMYKGSIVKMLVHGWTKAIGMTPEHRVWRGGESWEPIGKVSDHLMLPGDTYLPAPIDDGATRRILHRGVVDFEGYVYNLEVQDDHSYSLPVGVVHNCFFPADSEGFFRRSLLDAARKHANFGPIMNPREGCHYVMGIDPARSGDNFAIAIFEIDEAEKSVRLIRVLAYQNKPFPEMLRTTRDLIHHYKVSYFKMDHGGGGQTMRDLLADSSMCQPGEKPILERDNDDHRALTGDRILGPLVTFNKYDWVQLANHNLKNGLESGRLQIAANQIDGQLWTPEIGEAEQEIEETIREWSCVITIPVGGRLRWDTPSKKQRKDRYSAVLIGYDASLELLNTMLTPTSLATGFWN